MNKELLQKRASMKRKKPRFSTDDSRSRKRLRNKGAWTRPRGHDSKMRISFRGHKNMPAVGYSSPRLVRGLNREGLLPLLVSSLKDLDQNFSQAIAIFSSSVGMKKRLSLLEKAQEKKIRVEGVKDINKTLQEIKEGFEKKRKERKKKHEERGKKHEEEKRKEKKTEKEEEKKK